VQRKLWYISGYIWGIFDHVCLKNRQIKDDVAVVSSARKKIMIALLCSVKAEADLLLTRVTVARTTPLGCKVIVEGTVAGRDIVLCVGGMGKVNAAHAAAALLTSYQPEALIVFGVGGAYPLSGAKVGDVALAREEIAGDEGVLTAEGFKDAEFIGIPLLKTATAELYSTYGASTRLLERAEAALNERREFGKIPVGPFVTLSTCTGTNARARELEERYHGLCENMEGAAAAQVAACHNVPWLEVRGISNIVENRDLKKWNIPKAAEVAQKAVIAVLEGWAS
jgi:futalosine hydrolase